VSLRDVGSRPDPELVVEPGGDAGVDGQGGGLLPAARKRDHQPCVGALVQGLSRSEQPQARHDHVVAARCRRRVGVAQYHLRVLLPQRKHARTVAEEAHVGQGPAAPQPHGRLVAVAGGRRVAACRRCPVLGGLPEPDQVELARLGLEPVAGASGHDQGAAGAGRTVRHEHPAQPADVGLDQAHGRGGRPVRPQLVDDVVAVHEGAGGQREQAQYRPLARRSELGGRPARRPGLQRPENPQVDPDACRNTGWAGAIHALSETAAACRALSSGLVSRWPHRGWPTR
jgi:hypothetical protein